MTTALPKPPRASNGPPTMALPALPVAKTRKSSGLQQPVTPARSLTATSKPGLRAPSATLHHPPTSPAPASALAQPRSVSTLVNGASGKTLRKSVSINSFPQPPRGDNRAPSSPLARKAKTASSSTLHSGGTPSLLNGPGEGKAVGKGSTRFSDGLISVSSLPQSRSSSAQDSYSTSATTYEDDGTAPKLNTDAPSERQSKGDTKGNVLVSVRVRPDAGAQGRPDGEWLVDGRQSLIAYNGKEGGDHYYGQFLTNWCTECCSTNTDS